MNLMLVRHGIVAVAAGLAAFIGYALLESSGLGSYGAAAGGAIGGAIGSWLRNQLKK